MCCRCRTPLKHGRQVDNHLSSAFALAALILYTPAILLPMLRLEELGHVSENSLLSGVFTLLLEGQWLVGLVVLVFSVIFPLLKLLSLLLLGNRQVVNRSEHRAVVYRWVEALGRWGMLDVMLVAVLLAFVKLGDLIEISVGPGIIAFTVMVLFSLLAGVFFNPHALWRETDEAI